MAKYKVRDGFVVHLPPNRVHEAGDIIELSLDEADLVAHQIELLIDSEAEIIDNDELTGLTTMRMKTKKEKPTNDGSQK